MGRSGKIQKRLFAVEHPGHKNTKGPGEREDHQQEESDLQPAVLQSCQNFSGLSKAVRQVAQQQDAGR